MSEVTLDSQVVAALATSGLELLTVGDVPLVRLPDGYSIADLESKLPAPRRHRHKYTASDRVAFVALWKHFATDDSMAFCDLNSGTLTAVFDFSTRERPSWNAHQAVYAPRKSLDWLAWTRFNGKRMPQLEFAEFIENNLTCILRPSPGDMLEIATHMVAHRDIKFESATRLATGQTQFRYDETIRGQVAHGSIEIPERFVLGLSPFFNGQAFEIEARLRYRIQSGALMMWFELDRPDDFFQKAILHLVKAVETDIGSTVIFGEP